MSTASPLTLPALIARTRGVVATPNVIKPASHVVADEVLAMTKANATVPAVADEAFAAEWIHTVDAAHAKAAHALFGAIADVLGWHLRQWERDPATSDIERNALMQWIGAFRRLSARANVRCDELAM